MGTRDELMNALWAVYDAVTEDAVAWIRQDGGENKLAIAIANLKRINSEPALGRRPLPKPRWYEDGEFGPAHVEKVRVTVESYTPIQAITDDEWAKINAALAEEDSPE